MLSPTTRMLLDRADRRARAEAEFREHCFAVLGMKDAHTAPLPDLHAQFADGARVMRELIRFRRAKERWHAALRHGGKLPPKKRWTFKRVEVLLKNLQAAMRLLRYVSGAGRVA